MVGLDTLRKSDLLGSLSDEELRVIASVAREETYEAGALIFRENEPAQDVFIVSEGRVAVLIDIGRNKQTVIDTINFSQSFGWSAVVPPHIRTGTSKALTKTRVVALSGQDLRCVCRSNQGTCYSIMEKIAMIISRRLRETRLQLIDLVQG